ETTGGKPLFETKTLGVMKWRMFRGRYGYTFKSVKTFESRDLTMKEAVGFGGLRQRTVPLRFEKPVLQPESMFFLSPARGLGFVPLVYPVETTKTSVKPLVFTVTKPSTRFGMTWSFSVSPAKAMKRVSIQKQDVIPSLDVVSVRKSGTVLKTDVVPVSRSKARVEEVFKPYVPKSRFPAGLLFVPRGLFGRGSSSMLWSGFGKKYMFREFKIGRLKL
ncbi:MAG: hypothetical protein DRN24_07135, partial [Thermoplasmata archaeon]